MSQSINFRAVQWAYEQDGLGVTAKAVLVTFAMHANEHGYTWPGVDYIASRWGMDRKTVRRQIEVLLVRRMICRTKKTRGATGQVKVYRLPKLTYESECKSTPLENDQSGAKESLKSPIRGGKFPPNIGIMNKEKKSDDTRARETGTLPATTTTTSSSVLSLEEAKKHPLWKQFNAYCESKGGSPTLQGFNTWLAKQTRPKAKSKSSPASSNGAKEPLPPKISDEELAARFTEFKAANRAAGVVTAKPEEPF